MLRNELNFIPKLRGQEAQLLRKELNFVPKLRCQEAQLFVEPPSPGHQILVGLGKRKLQTGKLIYFWFCLGYLKKDWLGYSAPGDEESQLGDVQEVVQAHVAAPLAGQKRTCMTDTP
jgi:hypothetical protein